MSKTPELLPCPSCGSTEIRELRDDYMSSHKIYCECGMSAEFASDCKDPREEATKIWNTRVYPAEVQAAIERDTPKKPTNQFFKYRHRRGYCPGCKREIRSFYEYKVCRDCGQRLDWSEE